MTKRQKSLLIVDTSNGFDSLLLPETHKHYPRLITAALTRQLRTQHDWETFGRTLIQVCQLAIDLRHIGVLREVSDFLISLPVRKELQAMGVYYKALALLRTGEVDPARALFEGLASDPQFRWKCGAIVSAAGCYFDSGNLDASAELYREAHRVALQNGSEVVVALKSQWMIGRIHSVQGDHDIALKSLESLYPLVRYVAKTRLVVYYDYLNSLAVRQMALSRFDQAERLCKIFLAFPFARNFPMWTETRDELIEKREAATATVFVNIERQSEQNATVKVDAVRSDPTFDVRCETPVTKPSEVDFVLESQAVNKDVAVKSRFNCDRPKSVSIKLRYFTSITSVYSYPQRASKAAVQRNTTPDGQRRIVTVVLPDNCRPRGPPTSSKTIILVYPYRLAKWIALQATTDPIARSLRPADRCPAACANDRATSYLPSVDLDDSSTFCSRQLNQPPPVPASLSPRRIKVLREVGGEKQELPGFCSALSWMCVLFLIKPKYKDSGMTK